MDDETGRRKRSKKYLWRYKQAKGYGRRLWVLLQANISTIWTSMMLLLVVVLLVGICSQFRPPVIETVSSGETALDYSTFVNQIKAGNVLAVTIQGNKIHGLLVDPLSRERNSAPITKDRTKESVMRSTDPDYLAWSHFVHANDPAEASISGALPINPARAISTYMPAGGDTSLMSLLLSSHVVVSTFPLANNAVWLSLVWKLVPLVFMVVLLLVFIASARTSHRMDDHVNKMGKSRVNRFVRAKEANPLKAKKPVAPSKLGPASKPIVAHLNTEPPVTFADVAGIDEVRVELEEIVQFLRDPERFSRLGAHIPRGALLVGPPGTGKTLLAKAVAGEADVPFFSMSASEFVEMFVGVGASRVRDLFNQARQSAPCVIFLDEIDAVGRKRSVQMNGNDERDQTLNQLLVELDGFDSRTAVVVLAATNRVDILDKALLRPGRFDRRITVSLPDRIGREAILKVHTRYTPLHKDVSLHRLARMTTGMSGADLANLVNEAALSAARCDMECITHECFEEALARVQLGALRPIVISERERRIIAIHEGGHALVAYHLAQADTVNRVTILPRGQSLGITQFAAEEDRYNYSRETLMARIAVGLGGRVAEELTFGTDQITTGAENDLQVVNDLARRMVTRWGMSEGLGVVFTDYRAESDFSLNMQRIDPDAIPSQAHALVVDANGHVMLNGKSSTSGQILKMAIPKSHNAGGVMMNTLIDTEVQRILKEGQAMARTLLIEHSDQLTLLANALMEYEQLDRTQFEALLKM